MSSKAMSLKAKIRNIARKKGMSAQVVLQNYMFERFLERLSKTDYRDKFIIKGGILIASIVGINNRATMDMDATIKNYPLNVESLSKAIDDICSVKIDDNVKFSFRNIEPIREDDIYGGFKVSVRADFDTIIVPMQIDITAGDAITPEEKFYKFKMIFSDSTIGVWTYNIETVLAEKYETILRRSEFNTRPRDFYDIYVLTKTQDYSGELFADAVKNTSIKRGTTHIFTELDKRIDSINKSEDLKKQWNKYSKNYQYAKEIIYKDVINAIRELTLHIDYTAGK